MNEAALALGLGSAVTLAAANVFVKAGGDVLMSRAALQLCAGVLILPAALFVPAPDAQTWFWLAMAAPAHALYQAALIRALHRGAFSLVFPVMRGSAPLFTGFAAVFALGEPLSAWSVAGLLVAGAAICAFAWPDRALSRADGRQARAALSYALATGVLIAVYNVVDARGVRAAPRAETFIVYLFLLDWLGVNAAALITRGPAYYHGLRAKLGYGLAGGALSIASYGMALTGFRIAPVAHISALRETAVVFGAMMAAVWLKERFGWRRTGLAGVMALGLALLRGG